jgi:Mg2+-importing ATPase
LNNFLYDTSQLAIPTDHVDPDLLLRPKRWKIDFIRNFMLILGPISSLYDFLTFGILLWGFHALSLGKHGEMLFHTGWFVESLVTQTLVVFVIRTAGNPFKSLPSKQLLGAVLLIVAVSIVLPYTGFGRMIGFIPLKPIIVFAILLLTLTYMWVVQLVKVWFYQKNSMM